MGKKQCAWTSLLITCKTKQYADAIQHQMDLKKQLGFLPADLDILCIEDPQDGVGSGGATLNALLILTEHLSAKNGHTVVTSDVLSTARILIVHFGRYFPYDPCGRSFACLPLVPQHGGSRGLVTNFDSLFNTVSSKLAINSPPGLWVCSSDMLLKLDDDTVLNWEKMNVGDGVLCISVPATVEYATKHGVYCINDDNTVGDLIFQGNSEMLTKCTLRNDSVAVVTGIVFFSVSAAEKLLSTHVTPPLDACTYLGIDSGMDPLGLSLFFDILLPMATNVTEDEFVRGKRSGRYGRVSPQRKHKKKQMMHNARAVLWKFLRSVPMKALVLENGEHCYMDMMETSQKLCKNLCNISNLSGHIFSMRVHSHVLKPNSVSQDTLLINSIVEEGAVIGDNTCILHSHITANLKIGSNCYVYGLDEKSSQALGNKSIPSNSTVIGMFVSFCDREPTRLFAALRNTDTLMQVVENVNEKVENMPENLYESKAVVIPRSYVISASTAQSPPLPMSYRNLMLKKNLADQKNTLFMARLFPIFHPRQTVDIMSSINLLEDSYSNDMFQYWLDCWRCSLCEMLEHVDFSLELEYQQSIFHKVSCHMIGDILLNNFSISLLPFLDAFVATQQHEVILNFLDEVAIKAVECTENKQQRPDLSARCFACTADVLGVMAGSKGILRSGPSANKEWKQPLTLLEKGFVKGGVLGLAAIRKKWLGHPDSLIRASRHYEGAEQILIRHAVKSASQFIKTSPCAPLSFDMWYCAECPARIDLSGGWTDTPPICYEHGGSVVNVAILLNGKRPIGARVKKIKCPKIVLTLLGETESETQTIECLTTDQMSNYFQPQAPGALLKACCVLAGIVDPESTETLQNQLMSKFGGGYELQTWSQLPRGSGLGTSSILAGAAMAVLYRASGLAVDVNSLLHSVLVVEQMLTTGGGWQDQVGGLLGGVKISRSAVGLPLQITAENLKISDKFYNTFVSRLKLVYTGKTRLARNLLQTVLRNWYTKRSDIMENCFNLRENAEKCATAFNNGDLKAIGQCIEAYWVQKKVMASGCEPDLCTRMMKKFAPYVYGQSLCGAGGGGFLYLLTKERMSSQDIKHMLKDVQGAHDAEVFDVDIDRLGMVCHTNLEN
uniref:L-fucose kinase-like n=1 Tax=Phallusia mammillata TaxID=59560 RepID=A0A6F9DCK2_9ASCI|nr:L-fucose kinase-like [Phallusia mammillata]